MNFSIEISERSAKDGINLFTAYHYLLAVLLLAAALADLIFALLPALSGETETGVFLPLIGLIASLGLSGAYFFTARGLAATKNQARMYAIFLSFFGIFGGLIALLAVMVGLVNTTEPNWLSIGSAAFTLIMAYSLLSFLDVFVLIFFLNDRISSLFYRSESPAQAKEEVAD